MSTPLHFGNVDTDDSSPRRPGGHRKNKQPLLMEIRSAGKAAEDLKKNIALGLLAGRLRLHSLLRRNKCLNRVDMEADVKKVSKLFLRAEHNEEVKLSECLEFLNHLPDGNLRQKMVASLLEHAMNHLRACTFARPNTKGLLRKIERVDAYWRQVNAETDPEKIRELTSLDAIINKLSELT